MPHSVSPEPSPIAPSPRDEEDAPLPNAPPHDLEQPATALGANGRASAATEGAAKEEVRLEDLFDDDEDDDEFPGSSPSGVKTESSPPAGPL